MRSVDHAAELVGGYEALAARLALPAERVIDWSLGRACPDADSLLIVLDLIARETQRLACAVLAEQAALSSLRKADKSGETA